MFVLDLVFLFFLSTTPFTGNVIYSWYEGTYPDGTLLGTGQSPSFLINPTDTVSHYYIIAATVDCETPPSDSLVIRTVNKPEVFVQLDSLKVCEGSLFELSAAMVDTSLMYSWTTPEGTTIEDNVTGNIMANLMSGNGNYTLIGQIGDCVSDTAFTHVEINPRPRAPMINGEQIFCLGSDLVLNATQNTNADSYEWYRNGLIRQTTTDNLLEIPNATTDLSGSWTVVAIINGCSSLPSAPWQVTVDDLINVGATNDGPVCQGDSVTLTATFIPNATYQWSGPQFSANGLSVRAPAIAGDYTVTITTPALCSNVAVTEVQVNIAPQITALSSDHPTCVQPNTIITLSPTIFPVGNYEYSWTGPNGFNSTDARVTISNPNISNRGTYNLVVLNQGCPSNVASVSVNFDTSPAQPSIEGQLDLCEGDPLQLSASLSGMRYTWITPTGIFNLSNPEFNLTSTTVNNGGAYRLIVQNGMCPSDTSDEVVVVITPIPDVSQISGSQDICYGEDIVVNASITTGENYQWSTPLGVVSTGPVLTIPNATKANSGNYQLTYDVDGCTSPISLPFIVDVRDSLMQPSLLDTTLSICSDLSTTIEICLDPSSIESGSNYDIFNVSTGTIVSSTGGLCFIISDPSLFNQGLNQLVVQGINNGCPTPDSKPFNALVQAPPNIIATAIEDLIIACDEDDAVALMAANGPPQVDVNWVPLTPGVVINQPSNQSTLASNFLPGENLILLNYSQNGCINYSNDTVSVFVEMPPLVNDDNFIIDYNSTLVLDVFANDDNVPINKTITFDEDLLGTLRYNNQTDEIEYAPAIGFVGFETFEYEVCLQGCDDVCSTATVTLNIGLDQDCELPTIFTPNNDGINDQLIIPCIGSGLFNNNKLIVFNEWGDEVYSAEPYDNSWDGTYEGQSLPVGTYFVIFEIGNGQAPIRGFLTLQR